MVRRIAMLAIIGLSALAVATSDASAQFCYQCAGEIGGCPTCSGSEEGWVQCQQPYCGFCHAEGDRCLNDLAPDGSAFGSLVMGLEVDQGAVVRRSCDGAIVERRYTSERFAALRAESQTITFE